MSERHVLVLPRSGLVQLQLTGPKQDLGGLSVDGVPVGVHLISEGVVLALPLEAVKGPLDNQRIQGADVANCATVGPQVGCRHLVVEVGELHCGDAVQAEGRPCRLNVATDV